jgi:hypothetical protein
MLALSLNTTYTAGLNSEQLTANMPCHSPASFLKSKTFTTVSPKIEKKKYNEIYFSVK